MRSAEQVAGFLASIPDQQCALELNADRKNATPMIRCNQAEAEIALQAAPPQVLAALVTWLRANDVLRIEFFMEAGATRFRTSS